MLLFGVLGLEGGLEPGNIDGAGRKDIIKTMHLV